MEIMRGYDAPVMTNIRRSEYIEAVLAIGL